MPHLRRQTYGRPRLVLGTKKLEFAGYSPYYAKTPQVGMPERDAPCRNAKKKLGLEGLDVRKRMEANERLAAVQSRIAKAAAIPTRTQQGAPALLAVSKGQPVEKIRELYNLGQRAFGENYAQELAAKAEQLKDLDIDWHFIGHLQSNKIAKIVQVCGTIQSVASYRHAEAIQNYAHKFNRPAVQVFLNVNAAREANKHGCTLDEVDQLAAQISSSLTHLRVAGIMAIPPAELQFDDKGQKLKSPPDLYLQLRRVADRIGNHQLSLGMSGDLEHAITAGSTMVRIGTALFGPRTQSTTNNA